MKGKRILLGMMIVAVLSIMAQPSVSNAALYYGPIVMVEADPGTQVDGEMDVRFTVGFWGNWVLGEWVDSGFSAFIDEENNDLGTQVTKSGGTVVDFAIQSLSGTVLKLSDGHHAVIFWNPNSGTVEAPSWVTEWYDDASILWADGPNMVIEIVTTDGDPDGLAPVSIPSAVLLLGSGLMGVVGFRKKFRN